MCWGGWGGAVLTGSDQPRMTGGAELGKEGLHRYTTRVGGAGRQSPKGSSGMPLPRQHPAKAGLALTSSPSQPQ